MAWYRTDYPGRAERFAAALIEVLSVIEDSPLGYPSYRPNRASDVRVATIARFPFRIVYLAGVEAIEILAVADARQKPKRYPHAVDK
jgi:hypothetical protein